MKRILFSPDPPAETGAPPPPAENNLPPKGGDAVVPAAANPGGEPPPAATIVLESEPTASERKLQEQLDAEKAERKKEQMRLAELEDENHRLKTVTKPEPAAKKKKSGGWGLIQFED